MNPRVLVVEHAVCELPGIIGERAEELGFQVESLLVDDGTEFPEPEDFELVISLGSVESVTDPALPWIKRESAMLRRAVAVDVPIMGICFGGQILAHTLGGAVSRLPQPEFGWHRIDTDDEGLVPAGPWLLWHEDAFSVPRGAREIARTTVCSQAFVSGPHLGVQFHPEATVDIVAGWIEDAVARGEKLGDRGPQLLEATKRNATHSAHQARRLFDAFTAHARRESARLGRLWTNGIASRPKGLE